MQLGMIGLGRMGANLVRRLQRGGHECVVFDVNPESVDRLQGEGAVGGQTYLETMEGKVAEARRLIAASGLPTSIEVDGGISAATAPGAWKAGAELLVAGSAILAHPEGMPAAVAELRRSLQPGCPGALGAA
jgi:hypothetical protein